MSGPPASFSVSAGVILSLYFGQSGPGVVQVNSKIVHPLRESSPMGGPAVFGSGRRGLQRGGHKFTKRHALFARRSLDFLEQLVRKINWHDHKPITFITSFLSALVMRG